MKLVLCILVYCIMWLPVTAKKYYFVDEEIKFLEPSSPEYSKKVIELYRNLLKQKQPKVFQKIKHSDWLIFSVCGILNHVIPALEEAHIYPCGMEKIFITTEKNFDELFEVILWLEKNKLFKRHYVPFLCIYLYNKSVLSLEQRVKILFSKTLLFKSDFNRYGTLSAVFKLYNAPLFRKCRRDKTISLLIQKNLNALNNTIYNDNEKYMLSKLEIFIDCLIGNFINDHKFLKKRIAYFFNKFPEMLKKGKDKDYIYRTITSCTGVKVNDNKSFYHWLKNFNYSVEKDWSYNQKVHGENLEQAEKWGLLLE